MHNSLIFFTYPPHYVFDQSCQASVTHAVLHHAAHDHKNYLQVLVTTRAAAPAAGCLSQPQGDD